MPEEVKNKYECDSCPGSKHYVYDPDDWDGLDLDEQPDDWICPRCQATKDHFHLVVPKTYEDESADDDDDVDADLDLSERRLYYAPSNPDVASLKRRYEKERLDPQPFFQRYQVWTPKKNSRFIESILLGLPLPYIFLAEERTTRERQSSSMGSSD